MNPELIAAEIVDKLPELARDSKLNAHEFIAGKLRAAMTEESRMKSNGMSSMADRMDELAKRGLVYDVTRLPGRGRYANRFTFQWHDKLEELVRAAQAAGVYSPNEPSSATGGQQP